jgi:predicted dehydrogenase
VVASGLSRVGQVGEITVRRGDDRTVIAGDSRGAHGRALAAFADALREGRAPSPSGLDGVRCAQVMDAIAASLRTGRLERIAEVPAPSPTEARSA